MPHLAAGPRPRPCRRGGGARRARRPARASRSTSSPIRLSIVTLAAIRPVDPSGRPQIARICCSNCEVTRALDRPVAAIVDARRDFVDHRAVGAGEKFDGQHADMLERVGDAMGDGHAASSHCASQLAGGTVDGRRMPPSCTFCGRSQQAPVRHSAVRREDDRKFGVESRIALRPPPARRRSIPRLRAASSAERDPRLALAVVAEAAGLEQDWRPSSSIAAATSSGRRSPATARPARRHFRGSCFSTRPVLRDGQRAGAGAQLGAERGQRLDRQILELIGDDVDCRGECSRAPRHRRRRRG